MTSAMSPRVFLIASLAIATLVTGGCSAGGSSPAASATAVPTTPATAQPLVVVPTTLRGTYTASISGTTASSGTWTLEITASDLLLTNPNGGDPFSVDPSAVTESQLTVRPAADCPDQSTVTDGVYAISLTGATLTFTADHDSCGDRKATLASAPWTRKP
jgi:hypothetical protein